MAEGARLESVYTARYPGFESLSLRHILRQILLESYKYKKNIDLRRIRLVLNFLFVPHFTPTSEDFPYNTEFSVTWGPPKKLDFSDHLSMVNRRLSSMKAVIGNGLSVKTLLIVAAVFLAVHVCIAIYLELGDRKLLKVEKGGVRPWT